MSWLQPQPDELGALLAQLREVQGPLSTQDSQRVLSDTTPHSSTTTTSNTNSTDTSTPFIPSQDQLNTLLSSLTQPQAEGNQEEEYLQRIERDISALSFPESLPLLQQLSTNEEFLESLSQLKSEQYDEELRLKDERNRLEIQLSKTTTPQVTLQKLKNWDREVGLVKWKLLQEHQQLELQRLNVPTFQITKDPIILARQKRVMNVLLGFLDD